jgi:hypothetical protein
MCYTQLVYATTPQNQGVIIRGIQSIFLTGPRQVSLLAVADHDTNKATLLTPVDWNPILENGCPKSAGGLENVISLSMALGIPVHLSALDCAPFYHGYGEACSDARLTWSWEPGFVSQASEYVGVRRQLGSRGAILKIAYEDIRLAPNSSLLQELDALEHNCDASKDYGMDEPSPKQIFSSFLKSTASSPIDAPDESTKYVGLVASSVAQKLAPITLDREITEQVLLKQIQAAIGDSDVSITQLQWDPTWIFDKAVSTEKENYIKACHPIKLLDLPPPSNVISSHHFFSIKKTIRLYEGASFSPDRLHDRPEAARYLLTLVTACSDRDTHTLSKFS